jgi:quinol-cytochrome oxidoreductase complex cytochrome b subunit
LGYSLEDLSFFLGVAILWFLIGKWLDRRRLNELRSERRMAIRELLISVLLVALGLFMGLGFLYWGADGLRNPYKGGDYWATMISSIFFLVWSVGLILAVGKRIAKLARGFAQR